MGLPAGDLRVQQAGGSGAVLAFHHHRRAIGLRPHGAEEASDAGHEHSRPWLHWPHSCRPFSSFPEREPDGPHCTLHNGWCHQLTRALEAPSSFAIAAFSLRSTCDVGGTRRKPRHYNRPLDIGEPVHLQVQFHLQVVLRVLPFQGGTPIYAHMACSQRQFVLCLWAPHAEAAPLD